MHTQQSLFAETLIARAQDVLRQWDGGPDFALIERLVRRAFGRTTPNSLAIVHLGLAALSDTDFFLLVSERLEQLEARKAGRLDPLEKDYTTQGEMLAKMAKAAWGCSNEVDCSIMKLALAELSLDELRELVGAAFRKTPAQLLATPS